MNTLYHLGFNVYVGESAMCELLKANPKNPKKRHTKKADKKLKNLKKTT